VSIIDALGTDNQRTIVTTGWSQCDFPDELLLPGLQAKANRSSIPVSWRNLNTQLAIQRREHSAVGWHAHEREIFGRRMTLGLFWYSGAVELDVSLEPRPRVATEVLIDEMAYAADRFYLTREMRRAIWAQWHPGEQTAQHDLEHGWSVPFAEWSGEMDRPGAAEVEYFRSGVEAWMALFLVTYSDLEPSLDDPFAHPATRDVARRVREIVTPGLGPPPWDRQPEPEPDRPPPPRDPSDPTPVLTTLAGLLARFAAWLRGWLR
jgi:hypothetical protein